MALLDEPTIVAALIASVPATIAAVAAYRGVKRNTKQLRTGNGHTIGYVVQAISDRIDAVSERVDLHYKDNNEAHMAIVERLARMEESRTKRLEVP
jgi:hypothetical protein